MGLAALLATSGEWRAAVIGSFITRLGAERILRGVQVHHAVGAHGGGAPVHRVEHGGCHARVQLVIGEGC